MSAIPVRVMVQDVWDAVELELQPSASVAEVKERALALTHAPGRPEDFQVKFRGAQVLDEQRSLAEAGVVAKSSLIVIPRRRRPVR
jgi:hypothetical protein